MNSRLSAFVLLAGIVLISYGNSLENGFTYDDEGLVVHNALIRNVSDWPKLFTTHYWAGIRDANVNDQESSGLYRPLVSLTYALNYRIGGTAPVGYHLVNVLVHLLVVWLIFLLAVEMRMGPFPSLAAAALFAVHPIHTEAVSGVVGRAELMMALGFLGSLWCAARGRKWSSLLFYCLSLGSKEQGIMLPAVLVLYDLAVGRIYAGAGIGESCRIGTARYAPYALVTLAYLSLRWWVLGSPTEPHFVFLANPLGDLGFWQRWVPAMQVAGWYLWLSVWPTVLSLDYSYDSIPTAATFFHPGVLLSCSAWLGLLVLGIWSYRARGAVTFAVGLLFLTFLPVSNLLMPIGTILGERLFFLPSAGLCFLAGLGVRALMDQAQRRRPAGSRLIRLGVWAMVALICIAFLARTVARNRDFKDTEHLARAAIRAYPNNAKVHSILGRIAKEKSQWDAALRHFRTAVKIYPDYLNTDVSLNTNLGIALIQTGAVDEGVEAIERASRIDPNWSQAHYNLGLAYKIQRRYRESEAAYKQALALNDNDPRAHTGLGFLYLETGRYPQALESANLAIQREPNHVEALYTRARALELLNRPLEAAATYERIVELNPWRNGIARKARELREAAH